MKIDIYINYIGDSSFGEFVNDYKFRIEGLKNMLKESGEFDKFFYKDNFFAFDEFFEGLFTLDAGLIDRLDKGDFLSIECLEPIKYINPTILEKVYYEFGDWFVFGLNYKQFKSKEELSIELNPVDIDNQYQYRYFKDTRE